MESSAVTVSQKIQHMSVITALIKSHAIYYFVHFFFLKTTYFFNPFGGKKKF